MRWPEDWAYHHPSSPNIQRSLLCVYPCLSDSPQPRRVTHRLGMAGRVPMPFYLGRREPTQTNKIRSTPFLFRENRYRRAPCEARRAQSIKASFSVSTLGHSAMSKQQGTWAAHVVQRRMLQSFRALVDLVRRRRRPDARTALLCLRDGGKGVKNKPMQSSISRRKPMIHTVAT